MKRQRLSQLERLEFQLGNGWIGWTLVLISPLLYFAALESFLDRFGVFGWLIALGPPAILLLIGISVIVFAKLVRFQRIQERRIVNKLVRDSNERSDRTTYEQNAEPRPPTPH